MRKLVFLVLIALFALLAGWVAQRPTFHYLSDLRSRLAVDVAVASGAVTAGNLLGIEPELTALDYGNPDRLRLKLAGYLDNARRQGVLGPRSVVVLPEHIGTGLALVNEKPEVYTARQADEAIHWLMLGNPVRYARAWLQANGTQRQRDSLLRMKAWDMAGNYQRIFAGLAREYGITLVAGSIVLPGPQLVDGQLQVGPGPLRNVALVFGADGLPLGQPLIRPFLGDDPADLSAPLLRVQTPIGRVGVMLGSDATQPGVLDAAQVEWLAIPTLAPGPGRTAPAVPPDVLRQPGVKAALEVHLHGRLWQWQAGGASQVVTPTQVETTAPAPADAKPGAQAGAKLLNVRL